MAAAVSHNENVEFPSDKMVMINVRDVKDLSSQWGRFWQHDQQPTYDHRSILGIRLGLAEFTSSLDGKPMFALWVYDREPDGRSVNVAQDGSRGVSIAKKYGEMFPFARELEPGFIADVLQLVTKIKESDGFFTEQVVSGLRQKLKTGQRPSLDTPLQELVI